MKNVKRKFVLLLMLLYLITVAPLSLAETIAPIRPRPVLGKITIPVLTPEPVLTELSLGASGEEVLRLQERLTVLGFFHTVQDGKYGNNTSASVKELENYLRLLEQAEIDRLIEANKTPVPTVTPVPTPSPIPTSAPSATAEANFSTEPTPVFESTATPSPTPVPTPQTVVDGIADVVLQGIIYGDADQLYFRDAKAGSKGAEVLRIQRRLISLNYLNDIPDGIWGVNTETALKAFQTAHDLNASGTADRTTQSILFSEDAIPSSHPVYNQLYVGITGEYVRALQQQLRLLGFTNNKVSGTFDANTRSAVMLLEKHLHQWDLIQNGFLPLQAETTPVPEVILEHQGEIDGDPENNPYEIMPDDPSNNESVTLNGIPAPIDNTASQNTNSFSPTGVVSAALQERLFEEGVPVYLQDIQRGDSGEQVMRIQRRLYSLSYLTANGVDGIFGKGSENALKAFQRRNNLPESGIADWETQAVIFSEDARKALKPYLIKISVDNQRVYVYTHDSRDEYTILVKEFICSTGLNDTPTPLGTFTNTGPGARWHYFKKFECWAQYAYYINGDIMFHSVLYDEKDESTLRKGSVNALGKKASHGCVRLQVEDAQWIYNNCSAGTTVIVY